MPGFIEYEGKKGFLLKKEHISKIENAIKHRLEMWGISQDIIYKVYRCDSYYYYTSSIQKVFDEENSKKDKIKKLCISSEGEQIKINFIFDGQDGLSVQIESQDEDKSYLLYNDLRDYLEAEVLVIRSPKHAREVLVIICAAAVLIMFIAMTLSIPGIESAESVLEKSIDEKINYLIISRSKIKSEVSPMLMSMGGMLAVSFIVLWSRYIASILFKRNIFCWGKEEKNYIKYVKLRSKIFWAIGIPVVLAFLGFLLEKVFPEPFSSIK